MPKENPSPSPATGEGNGRFFTYSKGRAAPCRHRAIGSSNNHPALGIDGSALFLVAHENGKPKGQGAHTADEHGKDQNKLGDGVQVGCDAGGKPHGSKGRGGLIQAVYVEDIRVQRADDTRVNKDKQDGHKGQRKGLIHRWGREPVAQDHSLAFPADGAHDGCSQHGEGCGFDAAARRTRTGADEHEQHGKNLCELKL